MECVVRSFVACYYTLYITLLMSVAVINKSDGQRICDVTVTAVKLTLIRPPASNTVSNFLLSLNTFLLRYLYRIARHTENPANPNNNSSAASCFSIVGFNLKY